MAQKTAIDTISKTLAIIAIVGLLIFFYPIICSMIWAFFGGNLSYDSELATKMMFGGGTIALISGGLGVVLSVIKALTRK